MKNLALIFILSASIISFSFYNKSNSKSDNLLNEQKFVQYFVVGLDNIDDQIRIDEFLRAQEEIMMSRTDRSTGLAYIIFYHGYDLSEETFTKWHKELGFSIRCFRKGIYGVDEVYTRNNYICN